MQLELLLNKEPLPKGAGMGTAPNPPQAREGTVDSPLLKLNIGISSPPQSFIFIPKI
jgi:hypothetical protein